MRRVQLLFSVGCLCASLFGGGDAGTLAEDPSRATPCAGRLAVAKVRSACSMFLCFFLHGFLCLALAIRPVLIDLQERVTIHLIVKYSARAAVFRCFVVKTNAFHLARLSEGAARRGRGAFLRGCDENHEPIGRASRSTRSTATTRRAKPRPSCPPCKRARRPRPEQALAPVTARP